MITRAVLLFVVLSGAAATEAQASCGKFVIVKGDVKTESGQSKKVDVAVEGARICSGDAVITGKDARAKIAINDGAPSGTNELNISPDTKLVIENYEFNPSSNRKRVLLNVISGKIRATTTPNLYNDKAKDGQANTFEVRTKSAVAGVRGTDFITSYDKSTDRSEVITFHGQVMVGTRSPNGTITNAVYVAPGQHTVAVGGQPPAQPVALPKTEIRSLDSGSKTDSPGPAAAGPSSTPTTGDKDKDKDGSASNKDGNASNKDGAAADKSGDKNSDKSGDKTTAADKPADHARAPAAAPASGSMADHQDLSGAAGIAAGPTTNVPGAKLPDFNLAKPPTSAVPFVPTACAFCQQAVQSGPTKILINIQLPK